MTVKVVPLGTSELVDQLEESLAALVRKVGEPEELLDALMWAAALRLAVKDAEP